MDGDFLNGILIEEAAGGHESDFGLADVLDSDLHVRGSGRSERDIERRGEWHASGQSHKGQQPQVKEELHSERMGAERVTGRARCRRSERWV